MYNEGVKQKNNLFIIWQHIIGVCILVLTVLFSWLFLAEKTSDRLQDHIAQARKIALSHSSIATIETESFFHGKEAYLSFIGKDQEGQELAVLVAQAVRARARARSSEGRRRRFIRRTPFCGGRYRINPL